MEFDKRFNYRQVRECPQESALPFHYQFGGVDIASDMAFNRLRTASPVNKTYGRMTVTNEAGPAPVEESRYFRWPGRFGMVLGTAQGVWRFETPAGVVMAAHDASLVRVYTHSTDRTLLTDMFVRRVLPRLVKLMGGETYHAASLARDGRAILLFGPSGAGKSSMSIGLSISSGWTILGDDMALVRRDGVEVAAPSGADIAIWPRTSSAFDLPGRDLNLLTGYDGKQSFRPVEVDGPGVPGASGYPPVAGLYFLSRTACEKPSLCRLSRAEALEQALHQIVLLNPNGMAARERVTSVLALNRMLARVPAWRLDYPSSYAVYPHVSAAIADSLEG